MLYKLRRHIRPLFCRLNQTQTQRCMSSKRNVPIAWRPRSILSDVFSRDPWRDLRDKERNFENMWRGMDRMMGPRYFDTYYTRPRDAESRTEVFKRIPQIVNYTRDVNLETMTSSISEDGVLTSLAEIIEKEKATEKVIDIQKENKEKSDQNSD